MSNQSEMLHRGFEAGNYAHAYVSIDLDIALSAAKRDKHKAARMDDPAWIGAFVLAFFGSYEEHEVPSKYKARYNKALAYAQAMRDEGIAVD